MRLATLAAVAAALVSAGTARAQIGGAGTNLWGGTPRQIVNTPIDTSKAMKSTHVDKAFRMPSAKTNSPLGLSNFFPKLSMPSWPPKTAQVSVQPQSQNQFQPNPPKGAVNMFDFAKKK